jgi:outer membrane protein assembly factor BamB
LNTFHRFCFASAIILLATTNLRGTETENLGIAILPAPGVVNIDGQATDWDLSGGIFASGDAENMRDKAAVWFHAMYDEKYLYLLARFNDDSPLNNPGETAADHGFNGDCLQLRWIVASETPEERGGHITAWKGRDNRDVVLIEKGKTFKDGEIKDAKQLGVLQAFQANADGSGYVQELAVPWTLLTKDGQPLRAGDRMQLTIEPNFTLRGSARLTIKDIFKPGMPLDRIFTFMNWPQWGWATLEPRGHVSPRPVRLSDGREFPVRLEQNVPVVDWTGLIKGREFKGFKNIAIDVPGDGIVSLNILNKEGLVVRQLLNGEFLTKGKHQIPWDGLTNYSVKQPGDPVPAGEYTWTALYHPQFGLRFRGWACNGGSAPWDGPSGKTNWGGDHGVPAACAAAGDRVFLVWSGAEGGKMLLATNLLGEIQWGKNFTTMGGLWAVAVDGDAVYVQDGKRLSRVSAASGSYLPWDGEADIVLATLRPDFGKETESRGLAAKAGKIYLSYVKQNAVLVLDAKTGKLQKTLTIDSPDGLCAVNENLLYVVSGGKTVLAVNPESGEAKPLISGLANASGIAIDAAGQIYVAVGVPDNQVKVFTADGKPSRSIGRAGGRAIVGPWTPDGMAFVRGIAVDSKGQVWAAEADYSPKRVSVWDGASGKLVRDFFGPPPYGATGGAIMPADPNVMIGQGCEWRLDPVTGKSKCVAVITRDGMANSRFASGNGGRTYLAVASEWAFKPGWITIFERVGEGQYKPRARFDYEGENDATKKTIYWADENDDGQPQDNERTTMGGHLRFSGWWMRLAPDLAISTDTTLIKVAGFTPCGAPKYDFAHATKIPPQSVTTVDGRLALESGEYNTEHGVIRCFDVASGKQLWTYPDNFVGVHGSHNACGPTVGMIRGSFTPVASVKLPEPVGNVWVIPTNLGEWHILTERGFYLAKLFEGDPLRVKWPDEALPGAIFDSVPPGSGQEDFGGNVALAPDGKFYIQSGCSAFWNIELTGLDRVVAIPGSSLTMSNDDVAQARAIREQTLQTTVGQRELAIKKQTPKFTGNFDDDFRGSEIVNFSKQERQNLRFAAAWDEPNLYLAWQVDDLTPWINSADALELMYISGDTVDFQLATDPGADPKRTKAVLGDLRLSIGNLKGTPAAVLYRMVANEKHPKSFTSGVVKDFTVDSVQVLGDAVIDVRKEEKRYVVEAKVPLASLGIKLVAGTKLRGDFGVTFGDASGKRTGLRSYWSNQHTGIVEDVVYELMLEPQYWGELMFKP